MSRRYNLIGLNKKRLTNPAPMCYSDWANGRAQVFFLCSKMITADKKRLKHNNENLSGGGSRAHKNHTGMY